MNHGVHVQDPPSQGSNVRNADTGFHEPFSHERNTTLRHPAAKIGARAVIEAPSVPKVNKHPFFGHGKPHLPHSFSTPHLHHQHSRQHIVHRKLIEVEMEEDTYIESQIHITCDEAQGGDMHTRYATIRNKECVEATAMQNGIVALDLEEGGFVEAPVFGPECIKPVTKPKSIHNEPATQIDTQEHEDGKRKKGVLRKMHVQKS